MEKSFWPTLSNCLVPTLKRKDIVVIDIPAHKVVSVDEIIEAVGATLHYLPQYSPDLNPIELVFHPLMAFLRKAAEPTISGFAQGIRAFIPTIHTDECMKYFGHAGYAPL
jgi:transposase